MKKKFWVKLEGGLDRTPRIRPWDKTKINKTTEKKKKKKKKNNKKNKMARSDAAKKPHKERTPLEPLF